MKQNVEKENVNLIKERIVKGKKVTEEEIWEITKFKLNLVDKQMVWALGGWLAVIIAMMYLSGSFLMQILEKGIILNLLSVLVLLGSIIIIMKKYNPEKISEQAKKVIESILKEHYELIDYLIEKKK